MGFSGIDYTYGPYFEPHTKSKKGSQIDLLFDRADHVVLLCEVKYTNRAPGLDLIAETEKKVSLLSFKTKKTIQKILITKTAPSEQLIKRGYFYKIIPADSLMEDGT